MKFYALTFMLILFMLIILPARGGELIFSGNWSGVGNYVDHTGKSRTCEYIRISISLTIKKLTVLKGGHKCGKYESGSKDPISFDVRSGSLSFQGKVIGSKTPHEIMTEFDHSGGYTISNRMILTKFGDLFFIKSKISRSEFLFVTGVLKRTDKSL